MTDFRGPIHALCTLLIAAGCGAGDPLDDSGTGDFGGPEIPYEEMVQPIFNANCLCHMQGAQSMTMEAPYLTLNPGRSHGQLVGMAAEQLPSMNRVEPGRPEDSYLWHKLSGTAGSVGGSMATQMPQIGSLSADDLATIEDWILGGAQP